MNDEQRQYLIWLTDTTNEYRGKFINKAISIEQIIDEFLSWYFVGHDVNKRIHFYQLILTTAFSQKIKMFVSISKLIEADSDQYQLIVRRIESLRKRRNEFAHSKMDSRLASINNRITVRDRIHLMKIKNYEINEIELIKSVLDLELTSYDVLIEDLNNLLIEYIASL